jgi:serine/threonine protein kinase
MALPAGTRLGPYEIVSPLGAGGMGEVYQARDTKLNRDVALKILPEAFATDADRLARFKREAQVLASLNHQNIAAIYGFEDSGETHALVLELVEGPTLADRIAKGPIPLDEALPIARQIAEALETAHEQGIIHRDLKPTNVKVRKDGAVKVLDFGLAKLAESPISGVQDANRTASPTITTPAMTGVGVILGTAAYMSPEQAKGRPADKRSDVWAFGCVVYEMLTGKRAFAGEDVSDTLASVLKDEPHWKALPPDTPPSIRRLLRRSLEKDRKRRLSDPADASLEINEALLQIHDEPSVRTAARNRNWIAWVVMAVLAALAAVLAGTLRSRPSASEMRVEITTPPTTDLASFDISPDSQRIVFVGTSESRSHLWIRALDSVTPRPLLRTENATFPFWSPDGRSVGFFADGKLKRIDLESGTVQALADVSRPMGGTWNRDGVILFAPNRSGPIFRISASGGPTTALTRGPTADATTYGASLPHFLPDGRHFLYFLTGLVLRDGRGVFVGDLDGGDPRHLVDADNDASVAYASGHLLFRRQQTLFAQPFDPVKLTLSGSAIPLAETVAGVHTSVASGSTPLTIAYRVGRAGPLRRQLVWFDRSGKELGKLGDVYRADNGNPSMSPDGRQVVLGYASQGDGPSDLWLLDTTRGLSTRFTSDPFIDNFAVWSPDGRRIVFQSNPKGVLDLYEKPVNGGESQELLVSSTQNKSPSDWSPDGHWLLYRSIDPKTGSDLWVASMDKERRLIPVVQTAYDDRDGQFSPDGKWIAYTSNESGRDEIYVQPFPGPGAKQRISTNGGTQVRWRHDGKELFYVRPDERLMAVVVQAASAQALEAGEPTPLFVLHVGGIVQRIGVGADISRQQYMVSSDGQRFLVNTALEEMTTSPITLILNWAGVRR